MGLTLIVILATKPCFGQEGSASAAPAQEVLPQVTIKARTEAERQVSEEAAAGPASTLTGNALRSRVDATLGATLQDQPGVANASFGPNVGLPIVRGQGGTRTRALLGGIATHDASSFSADHALMLEPGLAEQITVWRGPSSVRFGGGAIGGAVEIDDGRIPLRLARRLEGRAELRAGADGALALARLGGPLGQVQAGAPSAWTWRVDAHGRSQQDARIPGQAIDEVAVTRQFGLVPVVNSSGVLPNTDARSSGGAVGVSRVSDGGLLGVAVSSYRTDYGIPPGPHSHNEAVPIGGATVSGAGDLRIRARQGRLSARAEIDTRWASMPSLVLTAAHTDYTHDEQEGGRVLTTFDHRVSELRAEWSHQLLGASSGKLGAQLQSRHFAATGIEAFVPPTDLRHAGVFGTARFERGPWQWDLGARVEHQQTRPSAQSTVLGQPRDLPVRRFTPGSVSAGLTRHYAHSMAHGSLTLNRWWVARAPDIQELYAGGPHHATHTFDLGNTGLDGEVLRGWDLGWQHAAGRFDVKLNAFIYRSDNYIYQRSLGWFYESEEGNPQAACARLDHCLPATKYEQAAAQLHGHEAELGWQLQPGQGLRLAVFTDAVRGRLMAGSDLPRMPPLRWGLALSDQEGAWQGEWRLTRAEPQRRAGENETPTAGYVRLDGSLRWQTRLEGGQRLALFVNGRNLTDQTIRNSTSFLRNFAPEAGRVLQLGVEAKL